MEESLKKQIKLLEEIVELQKKLLEAKPISYSGYIYGWYPPYYAPYQPWRPVWTNAVGSTGPVNAIETSTVVGQ